MRKARDSHSRGEDLAHRLYSARDRIGNPSGLLSRNLPVVKGVSPKGIFTYCMDSVIAAVLKILLECKRVFVYGRDVVLELGVEDQARLVVLAADHKISSAATGLLANFFIVEAEKCDKKGNVSSYVQYGPPSVLLDLVLTCEPVRKALPHIKVYARRPVFSADFIFIGPGWHPDHGVLVHGPDVEPAMLQPADLSLPALKRLPRHLRQLLKDFSFMSAADVANTVGAFLTGMLAPLFVTSGKPVALLDGNQPSVGKTLLVRVVGVVLDGVDPKSIHFTTDDEELAKRICATMRTGTQSVLLLDNAKVASGAAVSSPVIEANCMAPEISLRILGQSSNFSRPNDTLWALTMNNTRTSPDLVSRGLPIRLHYEGKAEDRDFGNADPIAYAKDHRTEILGELAGMVVLWNQRGRPEGSRRHRCNHWSRIVGGILECVGLPEFLGNIDEAAESFNTELDELAALAEAAIEAGGAVVNAQTGPASSARDASGCPGLPAGEWERLFVRAGVLVDRLNGAKSNRAKATILGGFLSKHVGKTVTVEVKGRQMHATLRRAEARANQTPYFFEVTAEGSAQADSTPRCGDHWVVVAQDEEHPVPDTEMKERPTAEGIAGDSVAENPRVEGEGSGGNGEAW